MSVKRLTSRIGASCWAGIIFCVALGLVIIRSGENRHASAGQALQESALAAVARQQKPDGKSSAKLNPKARAMVAEAYGRLPLSFEVNHGQVDRNVRFLARGRDYAVFLTATEAVLSFQQHAGGCRSANVSEEAQPSQLLAGHSMHGVLAPALVEMRLVGASPAPTVSGFERLRATANYFIGKDPKSWRAKVPTYARVRYKDVYPGIDLVYYGNRGQLEYDFVIEPGADPNAIRIALKGGGALKLSSQGDLVLTAEGKEIRFLKPRLYQELRGKKHDVAGRYVLRGARQVGFRVASYDTRLPLMIDPILSYSTYLGGASYDQANGIAADSLGNVYVAGFTQSSNFPITSGPVQSASAGNSDAFVTKLSADGSSLIYSTYLGSDAVDHALAIAVDALGSAYITGQTFGSKTVPFPITLGAYQTANNGFGDGFVAKLSPDGSSLVYSTFLGGSGLDEPRAIAVDVLGDAYVAGKTFSTDFPAVNAYQSANHGGEDAFVAELNPSGSALIYSTYFGGSDDDQANGIAVDVQGDAYITGSTKSSDFPAANAQQAACQSCPGLQDAFVAEIAAGGAGLVYSTFLGGSATDEGMGIAVDALGNAYVTGFTFSTNFPTTAGTYQGSLFGGSGAFVTKITPNGSSLVYSTYLASDNYTFGEGIATLNGNAYVSGITRANSFPVVNAIQSTRNGLPDAFVAEVDATGSSLAFSTYLGGRSFDEAVGIAVDALGNAYVTGHTRSKDFPLASPYQGAYGGGDSDAFITKILLAECDLYSRHGYRRCLSYCERGNADHSDAFRRLFDIHPERARRRRLHPRRQLSLAGGLFAKLRHGHAGREPCSAHDHRQ